MVETDISSDIFDKKDKNNKNQLTPQSFLSQPYKYGFTTNVEVENFPKGISENVINLISLKKEEPKFMLDFRLRAYKYWQQMVSPKWASVHYTDID
jgi:Fe-S cluster assembly protein SufB